MNHFLLPEGKSGDLEDVVFGLHAMELLINDMLKKGAEKRGLKAKQFGGASMIGGLSDIGVSPLPVSFSATKIFR
jgi:chemotaxis protein CheD